MVVVKATKTIIPIKVIETIEATKTIIPIKVIETIETAKTIIPVKESPSLKRWKPKAEFSIGPRCIGIRAIEPRMGAPRIGIRAIEARCGPLICAVAVETAKTHGSTQLRRINFFQFINFMVSNN